MGTGEVIALVAALTVMGLVLAYVAGVRLPKRKRNCGNKGPSHRFHEWSRWELTQEVSVYRELDPPRGLLGHNLHFARACTKCGLPELKIEKSRSSGNYE